MNKRIFPVKGNTWRNFSNYLNWVSSDIDSVQNYIDYWSPSYSILNQPVLATSVPSLQDVMPDAVPITTHTAYIGEPSSFIEITLIQPLHLQYREGIYCEKDHTYLWFNPELPKTSPDGKIYITETDWSEYISNKTAVFFPMSYVAFASKWTHTGTQSNSIELTDSKHYFLLAQSFTPIYASTTSLGTLSFECFKDGPGVTGSILTFSLEFTPSRYYLYNPEHMKWTGGQSWSINNINNLGETVVASSKNTTWLNSYPLMSSIQLFDSAINSCEEFIVDNIQSTATVKIGSRSGLEYSINTEYNNDNWTDFVRIILI